MCLLSDIWYNENKKGGYAMERKLTYEIKGAPRRELAQVISEAVEQ